MTEALLSQLRAVVGGSHLLTSGRRTRPYRTGFRSGGGPALAVVRPGSLVECWQVLRLCVEAGVAVIMQAANTGLTGGSTPDGDGYDRPVVIVSTLRIDRIDLIEEGRQVVCLAGATLDQLEARLKPLNRSPHSVIGSSCIGASVIGGICNNSGGALVRRGPAYTECALYARIDADGGLSLVNHLGIALGETPEEILGRLDRGDYGADDIDSGPGRASASDYGARVRDIEAPTPARYNADPTWLREASGSAGKLAVFAVRLDTFPAGETERVFYISTREASLLGELRRHMLTCFDHLPIAAEYMDRASCEIARAYGKDGFLLIRHLGTARMPRFFALKRRLESWLQRSTFLPRNLIERLLQAGAALFPEVLPPRLLALQDVYDHHLMIKTSGDGIAETERYLWQRLGAEGVSEMDGPGAWIACTPDEESAAFLHRFVTAGAAMRYAALNGMDNLIALDVALPRNCIDWLEELPDVMAQQCLAVLYYAHYFCHVFHQDYVLRPGVDARSFKAKLLALQDERGALYPAEHSFGHLYAAPPAVQAHLRHLDPSNTLNPGVGKMSKLRFYGCDCPAETDAPHASQPFCRAGTP
jgi:D-lactate dehydrogenase